LATERLGREWHLKTYLIAATGVLLIVLSVAACSSGPTGTPSAAPTSAAPVNTRAYGAGDLTTILSSVNTKLNLRGTVERQDGPQTQPIDALGALLNGNNLTVTPAHCVDLLQSDGQVLGDLGDEGVVASILSSSKLTIILTAVAGAPIPSSKVSNFTASQRALLTSCKHVGITETVDGQPTSIAVDYKPLAVNTAANQSVGFEESFAATAGGGSSTSSSITLEAIDGNLVIFVSGVTAQDEASLEKAVNAVVATANG
jgi:hypothetical protein